jgi:uncharacterized repeat protein (TIGR03803 family)
VFQVSPTGSETVLHSFNYTPDGRWPIGGVILDPAGDLYGTTTTGGAFSGGTVFQVSPTGSETVLYSFPGGPNDGQAPTWVIRDAAGNLYGTTVFGGANNHGTVPAFPERRGNGTVFVLITADPGLAANLKARAPRRFAPFRSLS